MGQVVRRPSRAAVNQRGEVQASVVFDDEQEHGVAADDSGHLLENVAEVLRRG